MSVNPARTLASAVPAMVWTGLWLYFAAPLLGMGLASEVYLQSFGRVYCAKLHHENDKRCIFHHGCEEGREAESPQLRSSERLRIRRISLHHEPSSPERPA
jgi:aquaporin Z